MSFCWFFFFFFFSKGVPYSSNLLGNQLYFYSQQTSVLSWEHAVFMWVYSIKKQMIIMSMLCWVFLLLVFPAYSVELPHIFSNNEIMSFLFWKVLRQFLSALIGKHRIVDTHLQDTLGKQLIQMIVVGISSLPLCGGILAIHARHCCLWRGVSMWVLILARQHDQMYLCQCQTIQTATGSTFLEEAAAKLL